MLEINQNIFLFSLIVNVLVLAMAGGLFVWCMKLRKDYQGLQQRQDEDFGALCSSGVRLGRRIDAADSRLSSAVIKLSQLESANPDFSSYQQAARLADKGAAVGDLIAECGLTQGEAELISNLQRLSPANKINAIS